MQSSLSGSLITIVNPNRFHIIQQYQCQSYHSSYLPSTVAEHPLLHLLHSTTIFEIFQSTYEMALLGETHLEVSTVYWTGIINCNDCSQRKEFRLHSISSILGLLPAESVSPPGEMARPAISWILNCGFWDGNRALNCHV